MAKGKTNQPVSIAVPDGWALRPEIHALVEQGHTVTEIPMVGIDLILAPQAHFFNDMMLDYLPAAITAARKRKREGKK